MIILCSLIAALPKQPPKKPERPNTFSARVRYYLLLLPIKVLQSFFSVTGL